VKLNRMSLLKILNNLSNENEAHSAEKTFINFIAVEVRDQVAARKDPDRDRPKLGF
jgi:hypothetical protein